MAVPFITPLVPTVPTIAVFVIEVDLRVNKPAPQSNVPFVTERLPETVILCPSVIPPSDELGLTARLAILPFENKPVGKTTAGLFVKITVTPAALASIFPLTTTGALPPTESVLLAPTVNVPAVKVSDGAVKLEDGNNKTPCELLIEVAPRIFKDPEIVCAVVPWNVTGTLLDVNTEFASCTQLPSTNNVAVVVEAKLA